MPAWLFEVLCAVVLLAILVGAFLFGQRVSVSKHDEPHLGVIQGATLGILGLLLGFSMSGAVGRFTQRQDVIVREANALGTSWLRAEFLEEPHAGQLRHHLREYTRSRLAIFDARSTSQVQAIEQQLADRQSDIWRTARAGIAQRPDLVMFVSMPLNETFDLLSTRNAMTRRHIPLAVLAVLVASVVLSTATISVGHEKRSRVTGALAIGLVLLIGAVLWVTIDLDFPGLGLIQVDGAPFQELLGQMERVH
jgi:hypothetical protein